MCVGAGNICMTSLPPCARGDSGGPRALGRQTILRNLEMLWAGRYRYGEGGLQVERVEKKEGVRLNGTHCMEWVSQGFGVLIGSTNIMAFGKPLTEKSGSSG